MRPLLLRYAMVIAVREWMRWGAIRPEIRVAVMSFAGAVVAPFVVFVRPLRRLYWLLTGKQPPRPFGLAMREPNVFVSPFSTAYPPEIRPLLERPEPGPEAGRVTLSWWLDAWARAGQALSWQSPRRLE
jgi:hypothetical protein